MTATPPAPPPAPGLLRVHFPDGAVLDIAPVPVGNTTIVDHRCRCGGRWIEGWITDTDGKPIHDYSTGIILHSEPPCGPFTRLPWYDFHRYMVSGVEPERKPIAVGGHDAPVARPAKVHHR